MILEDLERLSSRLSQLTQLMQTLVADNHALQRELNGQRQENLRLQAIMQTTLSALDATLEQLPLPPVLAAAIETDAAAEASEPAAITPNAPAPPPTPVVAARATDAPRPARATPAASRVSSRSSALA